jgi:DNA-binding NarL/FixJ family response regulator
VVLRERGYQVTVVESYDEFVEGFAGIARTKFDMVIATNTCLTPSDIQRMIPDLKAQHPHARLMVLSGYCADDFVSGLKEQGIDGFICLPFEEDVLIQEVAGLMADKPLTAEFE